MGPPDGVLGRLLLGPRIAVSVFRCRVTVDCVTVDIVTYVLHRLSVRLGEGVESGLQNIEGFVGPCL